MNGLLRKLVSPRLRRIPAALCVLAIAMQVMLPVLHGEHEAAFTTVATSDAPALQAAAEHGASDSHHHAAGCPQCRLVSQLKTLSPLTLLATLPALRFAWIVGSTHVVASSRATRDSGAPRAPPLLA